MPRQAPGAWSLLDSLPAHGDLVEIRLGPRPAYVVRRPNLARQVLTDLLGFDRTGLVYQRVRTAMGTGLASVGHQIDLVDEMFALTGHTGRWAPNPGR
jgi:pentalenene oxygenase